MKVFNITPKNRKRTRGKIKNKQVELIQINMSGGESLVFPDACTDIYFKVNLYFDDHYLPHNEWPQI